MFMACFAVLFGVLGTKMGAINMLNTMMQTAYQLLMDTVFYIMAIAVLAGTMSGLFTECGVVAIIDKMLSPLMEPAVRAGIKNTSIRKPITATKTYRSRKLLYWI